MNWVRESNFLEVRISLISLHSFPSSGFKYLENKTDISNTYAIWQGVNVIDWDEAWSSSCDQSIYDEMSDSSAFPLECVWTADC